MINLPHYAAGALIDLFGKLFIIVTVIGLAIAIGYHVTLSHKEVETKIEQHETER